jgi:hypothetical protein
MIQIADEDGNGTIEKNEFRKVMMRYRTGEAAGKAGWARLRLIDEIGGEEKVVNIVESFYRVLVTDGTLGHWF